jgi:hypothetical protein
MGLHSKTKRDFRERGSENKRVKARMVTSWRVYFRPVEEMNTLQESNGDPEYSQRMKLSTFLK